MSEYIKREDAIEMVLEPLNNMPAADVVEVVRCKDCKYKERERCGLTRYTVREYDFCSYGERKEK